MSMIDKKWIGHEIGSSVLAVERGRLKFFAKAIGETNLLYTDETLARRAGYIDLPAPPSFLFSAELDSGAMFRLLDLMDVPIQRILHGEQSFDYIGCVVAGDTVTVNSRVKNLYEKKGGALEFIEIESQAINQHGDPVARMRSLTVIRN
jgi:acyl dehydratase